MKIIRLVIASLALSLFGLGAAQANVTLTPLDPVAVDTSYQSIGAACCTGAMIDFVNNESFGVNIYWIDYSGNRVLYASDLLAGQSFLQGTFLTHPWLVTKFGSGDTLAEGTGELIAGFMAVTANPSFDRALADIAEIPEPESLALFGLALAGLAVVRRRKI